MWVRLGASWLLLDRTFLGLAVCSFQLMVYTQFMLQGFDEIVQAAPAGQQVAQ